VTDVGAAPTSGWRKYLLILAVAGVAGTLAFVFYLNTESFQRMVRRRLVAEVERITGGRAEVGSIHTIPFRLQVEVRNLTVHGRESATQAPLAHADSITARLKFSSLIRSELAFHELILDQPVIHVLFYGDGSSNFPRRAPAPSGQTAVEKLFALSIGRLEIRRGQILWDDQTIPLQVNAHNASLAMDYSFLRGRYDGRVLLGTVDTKLLDCRPFAWMSSADFSLGPDTVAFSSFKWNSAHSNFTARGQIAGFRHPRVQVVYEAHVDLSEAAAIGRRHDLRGGGLELRGEASGWLDQFTSNGQLSLRDVGWQNDRIEFSRAALSSDYSVTDRDLKVSKMQGRIFGGSFTGDGEINQWLAPEQHLSAAARKALETAFISAAPAPGKKIRQSPQARPPAVQSAVIALRLRDLSAGDLAAGLRVRARALPDLHLAGLLSGKVESRWKGTRRDAEVQFTLDAIPPDQVAFRQLPINGHATGSYGAAAGELELSQLTLSTPRSRLQASGTLSSASALRLAVSTSSLADWLPLLEAVRGPSLIPVSLNGRATFNGNLSGALSSPQLSGALELQNFEVDIPANGRRARLQTHWGSLSTSLQLSFRGIALRGATLHEGAASAEFDASASLENGHFTGQSEVNVQASLQHASLADLQALVGYDYPVTGTADLVVNAAGAFSNLHGSGRAHLNDVVAYREAIEQFDSTFQFASGELALDNIHLVHDDSAVTGNAAFKPASREFRANLAASNINLGRVSQLQSNGLPVDGRANLILRASGTPEAPVVNADLEIRQLSLDRELSGDLDLHAVTEGNVLHVTGDSRLSRGSLHLSGDVQLRPGESTDLLFRLDGVDLDALWRAYLGGQLTGHSAVTGTARLRGPLLRPGEWVLKGDLSGMALEIETIRLHNQEAVELEIANRALDIQQLHLLGEGTDIRGHGSVRISPPYSLDLAADGRLDMKLLSSFDANLVTSGLASIQINVGGTFDDPLPQGQLQFSDGAISYANLPSGLSDVGGSLLFSRDRVHIESLSAHTGGGTLAFQGDASYLNHQLNFNLTASGKDVRLRYPPGVSSTADATLHWVGTRAASTVSGDISVNKIAVTPGFDFGSYLDRGRQGSALSVANSPLNNIKLDVHVQTAPELQMRTAIARLSGDADFRLRGSVARPAVLGRVDVLEGQATFHGTRYTLERGDISFANPVSIEPQLNLQASTHVRNYDLNITVTGTPDRGLNLNYRSEPPLPKSDIIALLALGRTGDESAQLQQQSGQSTFTDQATELILNQALDATVSNRLQRLFGASNIKIDPQGLTTETNPVSTGPQITIEQEFANNISLTYSTNVSQSSQQIIQGEYYINRNVSLVGTRDQNGVVSFDVQVRRRSK
jgi:translocation and assembly module TamB